MWEIWPNDGIKKCLPRQKNYFLESKFSCYGHICRHKAHLSKKLVWPWTLMEMWEITMLSTLPYGNTLLKCRPVEGIREGTSAPSWTATESNPLESEEVLKLEVVRERFDLTQKCENCVTQQASHRLVVCQRSKSSENPSSSSFSVKICYTIRPELHDKTGNFCPII